MKKLISLFTVSAIILMFLLTGCSGSKDVPAETVLPGIPAEITEDSLWYSSTRREIQIGGGYGQIGFAPVMADDESVYILVDIWQPALTKEEYENGGEKWFQQLMKYSYREGRTVWEIKLEEMSSVIPVDDGMMIMTSVQDPKTYQDKRSLIKIDTDTGTLGEAVSDSKILTYINALPGGSSISSVIPLSSGTAFCACKNNMDGTYTPIIYLMDKEGNVTTKSLAAECKKLVMKNGFEFYKIDDTSIAVTGTNWMMYDDDSNDISGFILDVENDTFTELEPGGPLLTRDDGRGNSWRYCGNGLYCSDNYGINRYDEATDTESRSFDFNNTNTDRAEFMHDMAPLYSDDTTIVTGGMSYYSSSDGKFVIYIFDKQDKNPNAGKKVITVADTSEEFSSELSKAIYEFNEASDDVFVVMDDRYCLGRYVEEDERTEYQNRYADEYFNARSMWERTLSERMTAQLRMDILSGKGPDVILNASSYSQLDNGDVFIDLYDDVMSSDLDLFDNIIDAARTGDALYQVPLVFAVSGMTVQTYGPDGPIYDLPVEGKREMTFDEYKEFVEDECGGYDFFSFYYSRDELFMLLFRQLENDLIKDGKFDCDTEAFRKSAEYALENAGELPYEKVLKDAGDYEELDRFYSMCGVFYSSSYSFPRTEIAGIPSADGSGPSASPIFSIGVTADCQEAPAAKEFVMFMLSDRGQRCLLNERGPYYSINRRSMKNMAYRYAVDVLTPNIGQYAYYPGEETDITQMPPDPTETEITQRAEEYIGKAEPFVSSLNVYLKGNTEIESVVREEIGAYFAGDKTLDEIIPVINNRVNTIINERK